jgi:TolA-binding protein
VWTPTILLLDSEGRERVRLEGYLPNADFNSALRNGLGRLAFMRKKYADAERWYADVIARFAGTNFAPEAMYWRAVALYQKIHDHTALSEGARALRTTYPSSVWASKAIPWLP